MKFTVLMRFGDTIKRLTVSDTSPTPAMAKVRAWAKENDLAYDDIQVIPMTRGCYSPGVVDPPFHPTK